MDFDKKLVVSSSPHMRSDETVTVIMRDVIIAMIPILAASIFYFGLRALLMVGISVVSCMAFEWAIRRLMKKSNTIGDLSAVVTGMLIGFNLPVSAPLWMPVVGGFIAIVVTKQLFGGLGRNFMNPALVARVFLMTWAVQMTSFTKPLVWMQKAFSDNVDAVSSATTLSFLKEGTMPEASVLDLFLGNTAGALGETCSILILIGGAYLLFRKVITWHIPVAYIGTVAVLALVFPRTSSPVEAVLYEVLSGGLLLGAIFMATDYATSPLTSRGKLFYGVGCGLLTVFIRYFGSYAEGVSYSILIMNTLAWTFDKIGRPKRYGKGEKLNG